MRRLQLLHVRDNIYRISAAAPPSRQAWKMVFAELPHGLSDRMANSGQVCLATLSYIKAALEEAGTLLQTRFATALLLSFLGGSVGAGLLAIFSTSAI